LLNWFKIKILLSAITVAVILISGFMFAVGSHGNPEMMLAALFVSSIAGVAGGISIYLIWT